MVIFHPLPHSNQKTDLVSLGVWVDTIIQALADVLRIRTHTLTLGDVRRGVTIDGLLDRVRTDACIGLHLLACVVLGGAAV